MSKVRCPICDADMPGNWADYPDYPFCTPRCKRIDLGRWLGEDYRVAADDDRGRSTPGEDGADPGNNPAR